jgi:hypothetical protein
MGISQNTLLKWQSEGNSEQIGRIATAIRKAYGGVPDAPKEIVPEPEVLLD